MQARRWLSPLLFCVCLVATSNASATKPKAGVASRSAAAAKSYQPALTSQIKRWASETQRALGEARRANLGAKSQCLDSALSELHALGRIAQHQERDAASAGRRGVMARSSLRLTYQNAHSSYRSARECGAVRVTDSGSKLRVWIDPRVARFEPLHPDDRR